MPPLPPGVLSLQQPSSSHHSGSRMTGHGSSHFRGPPGSTASDIYTHQNQPHHPRHHTQTTNGNSRIHQSHHSTSDDHRKEKRRRELAGKLGQEMSDRHDEGWNLHESISTLQNTVARLITYPESYPLFNLRLLPVTIERAALLAQAEYEERVGIERARNAYEEDREQVEEEWRKGRERLRERLLEGIEERRRRARDEKEGEGTSGDSIMDSSSRIHITRKLRNKPGASPPPTPLDSATYVAPESSLLNTARPYSNPHSLSVDDLPSPFPIPLTTTTAIAVPQGGGGPINAGSRRRPKNNGGGQQQPAKILAPLAPYKYEEIEDDLNEIRRGNKRRRTMAVPVGKMGVV